MPRTSTGTVCVVIKWPFGLCNKQNVFLCQSEGTLLATGSYDGFARIWTKDGMNFSNFIDVLSYKV